MSGNRSTPSPGKRGGSGPRSNPGGLKGGQKGGQKGRAGRWKRIVGWLVVAVLAGLLVLAGIFYIAYKNTVIPNANAAFEAQTTYVTYSGGKSRIGKFADQNRESIPLADIPQSMQNAAIAAEDRTFYTNNGIDPKGIIRAAFSNAKGNPTQGASTITQQYVKILYLSQQRTFSRKVKEAFLSLKVQQQKSKEEILQGYLNTIYFGRGAYGVQAASMAYFDKPAKRLTVPQSAYLAAVLNSPTYLSSRSGHDALLRRYDYVLGGMVKLGTLDSTQADRYADHLPRLSKQASDNQYAGQNGFMLTMVKAELKAHGFTDAQIDTGGLRVETTFTKKAMDASRDGVLSNRPEGLKKLHVASASVDVKSGALLGFYGGQDYLKSQLNWASLGGSPGSAFKPFALAAGLKEGFSLKDTFEGNSPYTYPDGTTVQNEGSGTGTDYGSSISLLTATEQSVNTAYADLTQAIPDGPKKILNTAVSMGVPRKSAGLTPNAGIALGSVTLSPITMANAYATIADGGMHHTWFVVRKVSRASDGKVLYRAPHKTNRVLPDDIDRDVSYALQQVVKSGTGTNAQALGRPAAGKTGTATNKNDDVSSSWFVGYTPQVATAVMYVRGKGNEALNGYLPDYFGGTFPTKTWAAIEGAIVDGMPVEDFPPPAFVDGSAPQSGHAPYTPPPPPPPPSPSKSPKPKHTHKATPTPTPTRKPSTGPPSKSAGPPSPGANGQAACDPADPSCTG